MILAVSVLLPVVSRKDAGQYISHCHQVQWVAWTAPGTPARMNRHQSR